MASALKKKAASALSEARESVTNTAESIKASLTHAEKTIAASTQTVKTKAVAAPEKVSIQAIEVVDNALSKGIDGTKSLIHTLEDKKDKYSSKIRGAVGGGSSYISTDNQKKATSALSEARESVTNAAESIKASLSHAEKTIAASTQKVKTKAAAAPEKVSIQAIEVVDNALSKGIDGAKSLIHTLEDKKTKVSSKIRGAVGGASSNVSADNEPLLAHGETTPWWKICCGVLDLFKKDTTSSDRTSGICVREEPTSGIYVREAIVVCRSV